MYELSQDWPSESFYPLFRERIRWREWWDGSGYPAKLRGATIPLSARIVAVADVIDALCTVRPYKLAWSKIEVLEYLQNRSGSQFDPVIINVVIRHWDEFPFEEDVFLQMEVT